MKQKHNKSAAASDTGPAIPAEAAAILSQVQAVNAGDPAAGCQGMRARVMETAKRNAECDLGEANARLHLLKLEGNRNGADDASLVKSVLRIQLESIQVIRKLGGILDGLLEEKEKLAMILAPAAAAEAGLADLKASAGRLETRIAELRARDLRANDGDLGRLKDELSFATRVHDGGRWRSSSRDSWDEELGQELVGLIQEEKYRGEPTKEGLEARIAELPALIQEWEGRWENDLDERERTELRAAEAEVDQINAEILKRTPGVEELAARARAADERFDALNDAAIIAVDSALAVYGIRREMFRADPAG